MSKQIELIGYPQGNVIHVTEQEFEVLKGAADAEEELLIRFDDEPSGQWRFDNDKQEQLEHEIAQLRGEELEITDETLGDGNDDVPLRKFRVVIEFATADGHPGKWDWAELLDMDGEVNLVSVDEIEKMGIDE